MRRHKGRAMKEVGLTPKSACDKIYKHACVQIAGTAKSEGVKARSRVNATQTFGARLAAGCVAIRTNKRRILI